jgi:hypothetical protein
MKEVYTVDNIKLLLVPRSSILLFSSAELEQDVNLKVFKPFVYIPHHMTKDRTMECLLRDLLEIMMLLPVLLAAGYPALLALEISLGSGG